MQPKQKLLTLAIVIPAYNEEHYLPACLDAIAAQSIKPDEVIVVDNNSTDNTAAVAKRRHFVTLLNEPEQGIAFGRNRGFKATTADIIARIDADTRLPADWVKRVKSFFAEPGHEKFVLTGGCRFYNLRTGRLTASAYGLLVYRLNRLLLGYYFPWGSNSALPRAAWRAVRHDAIARTDIHEDLDLGIQLARHGYKTVYRPKMWVGARAQRVLENRGELWGYLAKWPRTVRVNGLYVWPCIWPICAAVWLGSYWILLTEKVAAWFD